MTVAIWPRADQDRAAIWKVNQAAFGADAEANLVNALRDGGFIEVWLVADRTNWLVLSGSVRGHCLCRNASGSATTTASRMDGRAGKSSSLPSAFAESSSQLEIAR